MPVEWLLGVPTQRITTRADAADMWAVGCVLLEAALGMQVFASDDASTQVVRVFQFLGHPPRSALSYLGAAAERLPLPAEGDPARADGLSQVRWGVVSSA
jgi:hypothetical protein